MGLRTSLSVRDSKCEVRTMRDAPNFVRPYYVNAPGVACSSLPVFIYYLRFLAVLKIYTLIGPVAVVPLG